MERSEHKSSAECDPTPSAEMCCVYVLQHQLTQELYYGYTNNLPRRLSEHQQHQPWYLAYYEAYRSESDARRREWQLKHHAQALTALKTRLHDSLGVGFNSGKRVTSPTPR